MSKRMMSIRRMRAIIDGPELEPRGEKGPADGTM